MSLRALACPASLKGSLSAAHAAERLVEGFRSAGVEADAIPIADGGEGTLAVLGGGSVAYETEDAFGRPRQALVGALPDGTFVVEAAQAIPFDPERLDVMAASSRGLGLLIKELRDCPLIVAVGGTATMDGGAGVLEVIDRLPGPTRVLCDVATKLYDAPRLYGPRRTPRSQGRALPAASERRWRHSAPSSCREPRPSSTCSVSTPGPTTSSSRARARWTRPRGRERRRPRSYAAAGRQASAASSSADEWSRATRSRSAATRAARRKTSSSWAGG